MTLLGRSRQRSFQIAKSCKMNSCSRRAVKKLALLQSSRGWSNINRIRLPSRQ
jgi:hypothetical protein